MSKINQFKITAFKLGYDNYFEILPNEIQNEVYRFEHKSNLKCVLDEHINKMLNYKMDTVDVKDTGISYSFENVDFDVIVTKTKCEHFVIIGDDLILYSLFTASNGISKKLNIPKFVRYLYANSNMLEYQQLHKKQPNDIYTCYTFKCYA
jgi:hypothetical protein